jgi:transposase
MKSVRTVEAATSQPMQTGKKKQYAYIRTTPINGYPALLRILRNRRRCNDCPSTYTPAIPGVARSHRVTTSLADLIHRMASDHTFAQIEREVGVNRSVARSLFVNHPITLQKLENRTTPRVLGFDGFHLSKSRTTVTDLENNRIWEMWEKGERSPNAKDELPEFFRQIPNPGIVEAVVIDMSHLYRNLIKKFLSSAAIIIDPWHVFRMHIKHFNKWNKSKKLPYRKALYSVRKHLKEEAENLEVSMLEETDTSGSKREARIRGAILAKFLSIYQATDRKQAEERLEVWRTMIEHHNLSGYKKLVEDTYQWKAEILAYFDFERKYTAAFTESANGILRAKYIAGRGYSFDFMRIWGMVRSPSCHKATSAKHE